MSLRLQLFGTIALVLLATLVIGALLTYRHAIDKIDTEMRAAIAVGSRIAHNAVDDVEEVVNPRRRLELLAADFDGDRHLRAFLVEPGGTIPALLLARTPMCPPANAPAAQRKLHASSIYFCKRAIKLDVSQRCPPKACTSA